MPEPATVPAEIEPRITFLARLKKLAKGLSMMFLWTGLVFAGAGRLNWLRGWLCITIYVVVMSGIGAIVHRANPGLLAAREKWQNAAAPLFDRIFVASYFPLTFLQVLVAGLDAGHFRWLPMPVWTFWAGLLLYLASTGFVLWTFTVNPFAETIVRIQSDRGHRVISSGPYRYLRHPMYAGSLLMYPATAMLFGSGWALAVAAVIDGLLVWRTAKEDRFLRIGLPGYEAFTVQTRYRLVPGIW